MNKQSKFILLVLLLTVGTFSFAKADAVPEVIDNLTYGKKSPQVLLVQQELIKLGLMTERATGVMYKGTMDAVRKFQTEMGISATGVVGPETKAALNTAFNQNNDCLIVTVPQRTKTPSLPFIVSGYIKSGCAWNVASGSAGTVQLLTPEGRAITLPSQVKTHSFGAGRPIFFSAQVVSPLMLYSGPAMLSFLDASVGMVPNIKVYPLTLK